MTREPLILIGGGGHCKSCIDVIEAGNRFRIVGIVDMKEKLKERVLGYEIIAGDDRLPDLVKKYSNVIITIGHIKNATPRVEKFGYMKGLGARLPVIISPFARVSQHASIGEGTIVMHNAVVNAGASVGNNCIINTGAIIEHDSIIGDHCHISTGAIINGGAKVGAKTFVGSNSMTREYIEIGEGSLIGGGVTVMGSVGPGTFMKCAGE